MNSGIPMDVAHAIDRLRREAKEKNRIADDLERHYKEGVYDAASAPREVRNESPKPDYSGQGEVGPITPYTALEPTAEDIKRRIKVRGSRCSDLADYFKVSKDKIKAVISSPGSGLKVLRMGWVAEIENR